MTEPWPTPLLLSVDDYLRMPMGGPTPRTDRSLTEVELQRLSMQAQDLVNSHVDGQLIYHSVPDELHAYRIEPATGALVIRLHRRPIRVIQSIAFVVGFGAGASRYGPGFDITPVETVQPPILQGNLVIDRNANIARVYRPVLSYNPGVFISAARTKFAVTYTAGYDDGTVQSDGVQLSAPPWLYQAIRATLLYLLEQRRRRASGRASQGSFSIGGVSESYRDDATDTLLPKGVTDLIDANFQNWTMGGSAPALP